MILFILSIILICISSYLVASTIYGRSTFIVGSRILGFIYFILISFAQIVVSFEILSIFSFISQIGFISLNLLFFIGSLFFWNKNNRPIYAPSIKNELVKIKKAFLKDKTLIILGAAFVFFIFVTLMLCIFVPVNSYDALSYHLARVPFWLSNGNLNHFSISDMRMLVMPINSELLYAWVLLFLKEDWCLGLFSFFGYFLSVIVLYNFLGDLKFCTRKKLWVVFIFSSLSSVLVEASGTETEIIIGGLILSSIYLFYRGVKECSNIPLYFSALAYALAIGTKTPAIMAFLPCLLLFFVIAYQNRKNEFYKPMALFLGFLIVNFVIFASYNYVLNFIDYSNPLGAETSINGHSFFGGFKAFIANFIRYNFLMFDFSGFNYGDSLGHYILSFQNKIFDVLNIPHNIGVIGKLTNKINKSTMDPLMGSGLLGFLLFIPCIFCSLLKGFRKPLNNKKVILAVLGLMFYLNIMILSGSIGFMVFSIRFLTFFIVISAPVLVYSYIKSNKNIFKWFVIYLSFSYLTVIASHIVARPFFKLQYLYKLEKTLPKFRERIRCSQTFSFENSVPECLLKRELEKRPQKKHIAFFVSHQFRYYPIKTLEQKGWKLDFLFLEDLEKYDLNKYDLIITNNTFQNSDLVKHYSERKNEYTLKNNKLIFFKDRKAQCFYVDKNNSMIHDGQNKMVVASICFIPTKYLRSQNFHLIKKIFVEDGTPENSESIMIYEKE